jgi:hypothetical protein
MSQRIIHLERTEIMRFYPDSSAKAAEPRL